MITVEAGTEVSKASIGRDTVIDGTPRGTAETGNGVCVGVGVGCADETPLISKDALMSHAIAKTSAVLSNRDAIVVLIILPQHCVTQQERETGCMVQVKSGQCRAFFTQLRVPAAWTAKNAN